MQASKITMDLVGKLYSIKLYNQCTIFLSFAREYQARTELLEGTKGVAQKGMAGQSCLRGQEVHQEHHQKRQPRQKRDGTFQITSSHVSRELVKRMKEVCTTESQEKLIKTHTISTMFLFDVIILQLKMSKLNICHNTFI